MLNGQQKLEEFLQAVEDWKSSKYLAEVEAPEEASIALNAGSDTIKSWTAETKRHTAITVTAPEAISGET